MIATTFASPLSVTLKRWLKQMFNENPPSKANSPLDSNDHPEVDTSKFLDEDGIQQYQSLIGSMQWAISIGRFDIAVHVSYLSKF